MSRNWRSKTSSVMFRSRQTNKKKMVECVIFKIQLK